MAIPADLLLQEDFDFPINEANLDQIRALQSRLPFLGQQRSIYGGGAIGSGGLNFTGYTPQYSSMVGPIATGQAYAQSISGGMPMSQVIAPGVSYSPDVPGGYTQADLNVVNLPRDVAPVFPEAPTTGEVFQPSYPTMPYAPTGTPMPTIFGFPAPQLPQIDLSQIQIPEIDLSQITIPESVKSSIGEFLGIPQIDVSQFVTREEIPSFEMPQIPEIDVSQFIGREELPSLVKNLPIELPQIDTSQFVSRQELPSLLPSIPKFDTSQFLTEQDIGELRSDILGSLPQPQIPDVSRFVTQEDIGGLRSDILGSLPQVQMPDVSQFVTQQDIQKAISGIPQQAMPDVSQFVTQADINRAIAGIPQVSLSDIEARLAALESAPVPTVPSYNLPKPLGFFS